jgi:intracellular sulfur oxidation DsrE/DsrF family protein
MTQQVRRTAKIVLALSLMGVSAYAETTTHRVVIQVNQSDPAIMSLALNNGANILAYFDRQHEKVEIEFVTFGPGINMLRNTSPVKDQVQQLADAPFSSRVRFLVCKNTKDSMESTEGNSITLLPDATLVPSGAARLIELQERGWTYFRP